MRQNIHPDYMNAKVHCACGNEFETRATLPEVQIETCSECHPFFTGKQMMLDTAGRVERFRRKYANLKTAPAAKGA